MCRVLESITEIHLAQTAIVRYTVVVTVGLVRTTLRFVRERLVAELAHEHVAEFAEIVRFVVAVMLGVVGVRFVFGVVVKGVGVHHHDDVALWCLRHLGEGVE